MLNSIEIWSIKIEEHKTYGLLYNILHQVSINLDFYINWALALSSVKITGI